MYWDAYAQTITQLLERPGAKIYIACTTEDQDQILGWCVAENEFRIPVVHYVYVKQPFRRLGLAKLLLSTALNARNYFRYTFRTKYANYLPDEYSAKYAPEIARRKAKTNEQQDRQSA